MNHNNWVIFLKKEHLSIISDRKQSVLPQNNNFK